MAYQLRIDEMLDCLLRNDSPKAQGFKASLESIGTAMAQEIGVMSETVAGECTFDIGTLCAPFYADSADQELPEMLEGYDTPDEFSIYMRLSDNATKRHPNNPPK